MGFFVPVVIGIGLNLLSSLFAPRPESPELQVPRSDYGFPIPKIYGKVRIEGNKFWPDTKEQIYKNRRRPAPVSGKGGRRRNEPPEVRATFATLFAQGPLSVDYIVLNGEEYDTNHSLFRNYCTWFDGTQTNPWSEMVALDRPPGSEIAYTGIAYLGIRQLPLRDDFGSQIPQQVSAVVTDLELGENPPLDLVVLDICKRAGIPENILDVSGIQGIELKHGLIVPETGEGYRQTLESLFQLFMFTAVEKKNGMIAFERIDVPTPSRIINVDDYHPVSENLLEMKSIVRKTESRSDLPNQLTVRFENPNKSYESDEIIEYFEESTKENSISLNPRWITTPQEARYRARRLLRQMYIQTRNEFTISIPSTYLSQLELLDHIILPTGEKMQINSMSLGANYLLNVKGTLYLGDQPFTEPPDSFIESGNRGDLNSVPYFLLDVPLVNPRHVPGTLYLFAPSPMTLVANNLKSLLSNGDNVAAIHERPSIYGNCNNILLPSLFGSVGVIDETNTINVTIESGSGFSSITNDEFNQNINLALVGRLDSGKWVGEFIVFRDVTIIDENIYELSYLKRGLFGTFRQSFNHTANSKIFLFTGANAYYSLMTFFVDNVSFFSGLPPSVNFVSLSSPFQNIEDGVSLDVTPDIVSARPSDISSISATIDPEENITFQWIYNTPFNFNNTDTNSLSYELNILDENDLTVRTELLSNLTYRYSRSVRLNDGILDTTIKVQITAINIVGRGDTLEQIVTPSEVNFNADETRVKVDQTEQPPRGVIEYLSSNTIKLESSFDDNKTTVTFNSQTISKSITSNYTLQIDDEYKWLKCSGDITITVPSNINNIRSFECIVQNVGNGTITIDGIPNASGDKITQQWKAAHLYFDTIEWTAVGGLSL